jgi:hypothetical protein
MKLEPRPNAFDDLLDSIEEYLQQHEDVMDGSDGPRPNQAMGLLRDLRQLRHALAVQSFLAAPQPKQPSSTETSAPAGNGVESDQADVAAGVAPSSVLSAERVATDDPGTVKILTALVDRAYKIFVMSGVLRAAEQDPDSNDPIVAWASDVRSILYRNQPRPDVERDLQRIK